MFPIYSLSSNQTTPRPISPQDVAIKHNAYLYLNNIYERIFGIEMMFDQGEKCVKQPEKSSENASSNRENHRQVFGGRGSG